MSGGQVSWSHALDPHLVTVTGRAAQIRYGRANFDLLRKMALLN